MSDTLSNLINELEDIKEQLETLRLEAPPSLFMNLYDSQAELEDAISKIKILMENDNE